jgi:signal transduction histidine kinase
VCRETGALFGAASVNLAHFTPDGINIAVAGWSLRDVHVPAGTEAPLEGETIDTLVLATGAPGRFDSYEHATGELAQLLRERGVRSEVGAPVVVDGRVWGALIAGTDEPEPLPTGLETRLASFAELIATAVSNAANQAELLASRARIVEAGDEQRRRVVRDLHDGAQQRLVNAVMTLQLGDVDAGIEHVRAAIAELRELARGIHPAILTDHGLAAAVESLADRAPLPVAVEIPETRFPPLIESAAYFICAEALTNVAKYAHAQRARVCVEQVDGRLELTISDDGVGGAEASAGGGLRGLQDRAAALHGTITVESPRGAGTRISVVLPIAEAAVEAHAG